MKNTESRGETTKGSAVVSPKTPRVRTNANAPAAPGKANRPGGRAIVLTPGQRAGAALSASAKTARSDSKPVSDRKIEANRKNGNKSGGPKSARGKLFSRVNALKHGMRARQALLLRGPMAEDPRQLNALYRRVHRAWSPVGEAEEMKVEELTWCQWLFLRSLRCENGYIDRNARIEIGAHSLDMPILKLATGRELSGALQYELHSLTDHLILPLGPALDQIIRYRQATLRQRDRAIVEMERLQRIRKGELVAAPLKVQLSNDG